MLKINVASIAKREDDVYDTAIKDFSRMASRYAKIEDKIIFDKKIAKAQTIGTNEARASYTDALAPLVGGYSIALHPAGKKVDSEGFSKLLTRGNPICFFIGGAYGFDEAFLALCHEKISLSDLTMSHKIAKVVLYEQIYRALAMQAGHPYHKE